MSDDLTPAEIRQQAAERVAHAHAGWVFTLDSDGSLMGERFVVAEEFETDGDAALSGLAMVREVKSSVVSKADRMEAMLDE